jgi:hypothetical protein
MITGQRINVDNNLDTNIGLKVTRVITEKIEQEKLFIILFSSYFLLNI